MIEILLFFIGASLLLYVLFGGADYGAGILEMLPAGKLREAQKKVINEAMGPVWEANHMWLVLVVVILFMGFPPVFTTLMISLHIPMVALLVGIVIRGCAFTFRHYDAVQEPRSQRVYTILFALSSVWTSLWLGIIVASLNRGRMDMHTQHFYDAYVAPWFGIYPLTMGVFVVVIFAFLASVYLIGETQDLELKRMFTRRAFFLNIFVVLCGGLVFASAEAESSSLLQEFIKHKIALLMMVFATLMYMLLWFVIRRQKTLWVRILSAAQVTLILGGWLFLYAPNALITTEGPMSFYTAAAPPATQLQLVIALIVGSCFIFPSLFYLMKVFKT
ncbi:MAG: cytochrome d ubiquinol oxidase subunit II [Bdellovibrionales bacterium]|nr:cytochrome d ubiquinol oxidase subunit II [Bdellovibrionales bacterium]